jgi:hypothetical protein
MQRVVANGFVPDDATLNRWQTEQNLSREAIVSSWKRRVDQSQTDWLLCPLRGRAAGIAAQSEENACRAGCRGKSAQRC